MKKLKICFITLFMVIVASLTGIKPAEATAVNHTVFNTWYYTQKYDEAGHWYYGQEHRFDVGGVPAYCVDVTSVAAEKGYDKVAINTYKKLTAEEKEYINLVSYFGYGYNGDESAQRYIAAQTLIWQKIHGYKTIWYATYEEAKDNNGTAKKGADPKITEIKALIKEYYQTPKWEAYDLEGNLLASPDEKGCVTIEGYVGQVFKLIDTNNRLEHYYLKNLTNAILCDSQGKPLDIEKFEDFDTTTADNTIYIKVTSEGQTSLRVKSNLETWEVSDTTRPFVLTKSGSQSIYVMGSLDPIYGQIKFDLDQNLANVDVQKKNADDNYVVGAKYGIYTDAECTVFAKDINNANAVITTTAEGSNVVSLSKGGTYYVKEYEAPKGYYYSDQVETFTVPEPIVTNQSFTITDTDKAFTVKIYKKDTEGTTIGGIKLQIKDGNTLVHEWTTIANEPKEFTDLKAGVEYTLIESEWVGGVYKATDKTFTIDKYGDDDEITITMVDDIVGDIAVLKKDQNDKLIADLTLEILDENKQVVTTITTTLDKDGVSTDTNGKSLSEVLKGGKTYYLHEPEANVPDGFQQAKDVEFTVTSKKGEVAQLVVMTDEGIEYWAKVLKTDVATNKPLADCEFTVYENATGNVAKMFNEETGKYDIDAIGVTDGEGALTFKLQQTVGGYYLQETKTPFGYLIEDTQYQIDLATLDKEANTVVLSITNRPADIGIIKLYVGNGVWNPNTGEFTKTDVKPLNPIVATLTGAYGGTNYVPYLAAVGSILCGIVVVLILKKQNKKRGSIN